MLVSLKEYNGQLLLLYIHPVRRGTYPWALRYTHQHTYFCQAYNWGERQNICIKRCGKVTIIFVTATIILVHTFPSIKQKGKNITMDKILEKNYQSYTQKRICKKKEKFPKNGEWEEQRKKLIKYPYIYIYTHTQI